MLLAGPRLTWISSYIYYFLAPRHIASHSARVVPASKPFLVEPLTLLLLGFECLSARRSCSRRSLGGSSNAILAVEATP